MFLIQHNAREPLHCAGPSVSADNYHVSAWYNYESTVLIYQFCLSVHDLPHADIVVVVVTVCAYNACVLSH